MDPRYLKQTYSPSELAEIFADEFEGVNKSNDLLLYDIFKQSYESTILYAQRMKKLPRSETISYDSIIKWLSTLREKRKGVVVAEEPSDGFQRPLSREITVPEAWWEYRNGGNPTNTIEKKVGQGDLDAECEPEVRQAIEAINTALLAQNFQDELKERDGESCKKLKKKQIMKLIELKYPSLFIKAKTRRITKLVRRILTYNDYGTESDIQRIAFQKLKRSLKATD